MIEPGYVLMMARYNAWQNRQIMDILKVMNEAELYVDHKAFFGTIMGTLNHILWGDTIWMSRFCSDVAPPDVPREQHKEFTQTVGDWEAKRFAMDGRMRIWAQTLSNLDLVGDMTWIYTATGAEMRQPKAMMISHLFNHQTHHRGQVHAMLTAGGHDAPVTDIIFMPEDA